MGPPKYPAELADEPTLYEVLRAGYQFYFVHQSDTATAVHETRTWLYKNFTGQKLSNDLE